jgi:hypothetical protein
VEKFMSILNFLPFFFGVLIFNAINNGVGLITLDAILKFMNLDFCADLSF